MVFVLGVHGKAKAGKDSFADFLIKNHGWDGKVSFAGNLKEMCKEIFFLTDYDLNDPAGKEKDFKSPKIFTQRNLGSVLHWVSRTVPNPALIRLPRGARAKVAALIGTELKNPRDVMQFVGTDICRTVHPSYHTDIIKNKLLSSAGKWVITDVRFPNEFELVDEFKGQTIEIRRADSDISEINSKHASETSLENWDFADVIENDSEGLENYHNKINSFLERNKRWWTEGIQSQDVGSTSSSLTGGTGILSGTGTIQVTNLTGEDSGQTP
jgi:hypothetical protein